MFAPANTAQFALLPTVRHDFKVLAFDGAEAISPLHAIRVELVSDNPDHDLEILLSQPGMSLTLKAVGQHILITPSGIFKRTRRSRRRACGGRPDSRFHAPRTGADEPAKQDLTS